MSWPMVEAGELMARRSGSVDPSKFPDERFELHSIPAFDAGKPDVLLGCDIGSSKQIVQPDDVMISKIVPHIRRASVVGASSGLRQIGSGEWIVFRSDRIYPHYLRHFLTSDDFNAQFMSTVSGVGGSLLRARPAEVAKIKVPLPPLPEQRRIAAILDKADALRSKRRLAIAKLDQLLQSVFLEMFGDKAIAANQWPKVAIGDVCAVKGGKRLTKGDDYSPVPTAFRYIRVSDLEMGRIKEDELKYLPPYVQAKISRYIVNENDVVISIAGTIGVVAPVPASLNGVNLTENAAKLVPIKGDAYDAEYLAYALASPDAQDQIRSHTGQVTIGKLALFRIEKVTIPMPPLAQQRLFASLKNQIGARRLQLDQSERYASDFVASLQKQCFATGLLPQEPPEP